MMLDCFKQYIKISRRISDKSVDHYVSALNTINALLVKYGYSIKSVYEASSSQDLTAIQLFLNSNEEFITKDAVGHNMYSVAFKHYFEFACKDADFFCSHMNEMDIALQKPEFITQSHGTWKRNQLLIGQAIDAANHLCEFDAEHKTFIAQATNQAYMEGHHLIHMRYQEQFACSLDVYANIICLCPICHRILHFGTVKDKDYIISALYVKRVSRLSNSGLNISKQDLISLVCHQ